MVKNEAAAAIYRMARDVVDALLHNSVSDTDESQDLSEEVVNAIMDSVSEFAAHLAAGDIAVYNQVQAETAVIMEESFNAERHFIMSHCADCGDPLGDIDVTLEEDGVTPSEPSGDKGVKN